MIEATAWKTTLEKGTKRCVYRMEVKGVSKDTRKQINSALTGWRESGYGYNARTGEEILFFSKDFGDTQKWMEWAKSFDAFVLKELDKNGDVKKYVRIGLKPGQVSSITGRKSSLKKGTRSCSKCGESGHNARTCRAAFRKTEITVQQKSPVKGKRKCSICGGSGHNSRTCRDK